MAYQQRFKPKINILFHGNCVDGWFSAFIARDYYVTRGIKNIGMYAISPNLKHTWPKVDKLRGSHIIMTDVSVPVKTMQYWRSISRSFLCIDHHATAKDAMEEMGEESCCFSIDRCATWLAYEHYHGRFDIPEWVKVIDRIDRWEDVTHEDRCLREILHEIAILPVNNRVDDAVAYTNAFLFAAEKPELLEDWILLGQDYLAPKADANSGIMTLGYVVPFDDAVIAKWSLPTEWLGETAFIVNTTGITIDSTSMAFDVFKAKPECNIFINYRLKKYTRPDGVTTETYIYSARARDKSSVDLTLGGIFAGHPYSAGASRPAAIAVFV